MALSVVKQGIEAERLVGTGEAQSLLRAEAMVSGAGREAVTVLMADAFFAPGVVEVQQGRVVMDGTVYAQAAYRLGEEKAVRALAAQTTVNQVIDLPGAETKMSARADGRVEHVDASYENGHMVFHITVDTRAQVFQLSPVEATTEVTGISGLETRYAELCSVKRSAEATESALLREEVTLPAALEARTSLMDWFCVSVDGVSRELGGVKVAGRVEVEALIASGVAGRPVALVKYAVPFEKLVAMPEWLTGDVSADAVVKRLSTETVEGDPGSDSRLDIEIELLICVTAQGRDCVRTLVDAYGSGASDVTVTYEEIEICGGTERFDDEDGFRGTLLLPSGSVGAGTVLVTRVNPILSERENVMGRTVLRGVLEVTALYLPTGGGAPASASGELPFEIRASGEIPESAWLTLRVRGAEASALMSDRLEVRCTLGIRGDARKRENQTIVESLTETEAAPIERGIVMIWPSSEDTLWTVGKRYRLPRERAVSLNGGSEELRADQALVTRIE